RCKVDLALIERMHRSPRQPDDPDQFVADHNRKAEERAQSAASGEWIRVVRVGLSVGDVDRPPGESHPPDHALHPGPLWVRLLALNNRGRRTEARPGAKHITVAQPDEGLLRPAKPRCVRDNLVKNWLKSQATPRHRHQHVRDSFLPNSKLV